VARFPISTGAVAVAAAVIGAATLAIDPGDLDPQATVVVLAGMVVAALTAYVGLVLVRAPWGRWSLLGSVVVGLILASLAGGWMFWLDLALGAVAIVGITGPWLRLWVRHAPVVDRPGPAVIALIAVGPITPLFVGVTALAGLHPLHLVLIAVTMLSSWAYGRGISLGIWGLRTVVPVAGLAAVVVTLWPGSLPLGAAVAATSIVAWLPHARRATAVITPPLPAPVYRRDEGIPDASD
jgi:hypothetical protein